MDKTGKGTMGRYSKGYHVPSLTFTVPSTQSMYPYLPYSLDISLVKLVKELWEGTV